MVRESWDISTDRQRVLLRLGDILEEDPSGHGADAGPLGRARHPPDLGAATGGRRRQAHAAVKAPLVSIGVVALRHVPAFDDTERLRPLPGAGQWVACFALWSADGRGSPPGQPGFPAVWGGEPVSELGSQISLLAIPLLAVNSLHATAFEMGLLTAAWTATFLIVGLPAGVWVDHVRRRRLMIATDLGRFLALGSIPIAYAVGGLTLVQLFVVTLASGILTVFFDVAYQSYLPSLVGRETWWRGTPSSPAPQVAAVAGPSVAGGLVQAIGGAAAVAVDAGAS